MRTRTCIGFVMLVVTVASVNAQAWDIDVSNTRVAVKRFFVFNRENRANIERIWFDDQQRPVMSAFLRDDGSERSRKIYRYDEWGMRVEYSFWDQRGDGFTRQHHEATERTVENGVVTYRTSLQRYNELPYLSRILRMSADGTWISDEYRGVDGSYYYREYDEYGEMVFHRYEHEKSNGMREIRQSIEYGTNGLPVRIVASEAGETVSITTKEYNASGLITREVVDNLSRDTSQSIDYHYEDGLLVERVVTDMKTGEVRIRFYTEYDDDGWITRWGDIRSDHELHRVYEYE